MMDRVMTKEHQEALGKQLPVLVQSLHLTGLFWAFLMKDHVCSTSDREAIENKKSADGDKVLELVTLLMKRPDRCYEIFVEALRQTDQTHLAALLEIEKPEPIEVPLDSVATSLDPPLHRAQNNMTMVAQGNQQGSSAGENKVTSIPPRQVWTLVRNDVKNFLESQVMCKPANNDYCTKKYEYYLGDPDDIAEEYEEERGEPVHEELVRQVAHSIGIKFYGESIDVLCDEWSSCRICGILKQRVEQETVVDRWQQQLYQHQQSAERVTSYCQRVSEGGEGDPGELVLYLRLMDCTIDDYQPLVIGVTIYDMKRSNQSWFMWEYIRAGFGTQQLLSCLLCYLKRHLQGVRTHRLVLVTRPYGGLLRNTDLIVFGLWLMFYFHIKELRVIYQYYCYRSDVLRHGDSTQAVDVIQTFIRQSTPPFKPLQDIISDKGYRGITCMTSDMMSDMSAMKEHEGTVNWEEIQVSLNTTRCLHMTTQGSECIVKMEKYFHNNAVSAAYVNRDDGFRIPLLSGENQLLPLHPHGNTLIAEYYNVITAIYPRWKEYFRTHAKVDWSDTSKVIPDPGLIIQETDCLHDDGDDDDDDDDDDDHDS